MNPSYFIFFLFVLLGTLVIAHWSAQRGTTTYRFYSAAGRLTGFQNGLAMAGDFLSAASFLGVTGTIALYGFDGTLYAIGFFVSYFLLWAVAKPVHRLGRYTLAEVVCMRFPSKWVRLLTAINTVIISMCYMVPQLIAAGFLIRLLLGLNYAAAVIATGLMMVIYVVFGGMVSTSWIQIIKTVLLLSTVALLTGIVLSRLHFNLVAGLHAVARNNPYGVQFFHPGQLMKTPLNRWSVLVSLFLGTAGLPHVLVRFFTVRSDRGVRWSIITGTSVVGVFYALSVVLGLGAVAMVGWTTIHHVDPTGNLSVPLLARKVGGEFFTAFISAVAFATILAVVTGLLLTATAALSHDIYDVFIPHGKRDEKGELRTARWIAAGIGMLSVFMSLGIGHMNVTFPVTLIFVVAAATNLPLLLFTFYWKRFNTTGAITGVLSGFGSSLLLTIIDSHVLGALPSNLSTLALFQLDNLGLFAIPCGFAGAVVGTFCAKTSQDGQVDYLHFASKFRNDASYAQVANSE